MLDISCDSAALGVHQDAAVRFCQSAIESAERDQEMHIQTVMNNKQQQAGLDIASNRNFFLKMKLVKKNPRQKNFPGEIPGMVGQVEMFMSIFNMLQQDRGRRATGNITFTEFEQLFDRREIRAFFEVGFSVSTKCLL